MPDFANGKIYKITHGDETYYGSTALTLKKRMSLHKSSFKKWKDGTANNCKSFTLFDKYGFDNCPIELVEAYPCETKKDLIIREDWYIKTMDCINKNAAYTSKEEVKEQKRQHHLDHKEEHNEQSRQWYQDNKEEAKEQKRQWYQDHREEALDNRHQHYQANKEVINEKRKEKIVCECGRTVCKDGIADHRKSLIHLANI